MKAKATNTKGRKVTITLPAELVEAAEQRLRQGERTRSALIIRLVQDLLKTQDERAQEEARLVEEWKRGYQEQPQTEDEVSFALAMAQEWAKRNPEKW